MGVRAREIVYGGVALVLAQVIVAVVQVVYSGFTSRIFSPEVFGAFAISVTGIGLVTLMLSTGLPSFLLSQRELTDGQIVSTVSLSYLAGALGALMAYAGAPGWGSLWQSPSSVEFTRLLSAQLLFSPAAATQLALLRREGRPLADAVTMSISAVTATAIGGALIFHFRDTMALTVAPIGTALLTLVLASMSRRIRAVSRRPAGWVGALSHVRGVWAHNLALYAFTSTPLWSASLLIGDTELGYFSRALLLAGLASTALFGALNRAVQPYYRHLPDNERSIAIGDAMSVAAAVALPIFFGLAAVSAPVVAIWLGPRWAPTGTLLAPLAIGYGLYLLYGMLVSAAELTFKFRCIRVAQLYMLSPVIILLLCAYQTRNLMFIAWMTAAVSLVGIISMIFLLDRQGVVNRRVLTRGLGAQIIWATGIALLMWATVAVFPPDRFGALASTILACAFGLLFWTGSFRFQPAWGILRRRMGR